MIMQDKNMVGRKTKVNVKKGNPTQLIKILR